MYKLAKPYIAVLLSLCLLNASTAWAATVDNTATATVPAGYVDPDTSNNISTDSDLIVDTSDLVVSKTNNATSVNAGGTTTYVVRVTNNGPSPVSGATLVDPASGGLMKTAVACSATPGVCATAPTPAQIESGSFVLPDMAAGTFYEIAISADVTAASGDVTNVAMATAPTGWTDPNPQNNTGSDSDPVIPVPIPPVADNDTVKGLPTGTPAVVTVLNNDSDADGTLDPTSVVFVSPPTGSTLSPDSKALTVPGEGVWKVDPTGVLIFTPETGFTASPTPVSYTVADNDGNVSGPATVTLSFTAVLPVANSDAITDLPPGTPALVTVLGNDNDPDGSLDPTTVVFVSPPTGSTLTPDGKTLTVPGEGVWTIDPAGVMTFTPETGFTANPTPVNYTVADNDGNVSGPASVTLAFKPSAPATVTGTVFLDVNGDGILSGDPDAGPGYIVEIVDAGGKVIGNSVTNDHGFYSITVPPGTDYTLVFKAPAGGEIGKVENLALAPGATVIDQDQPVDPSGVVYDSVTRAPVAGATVTLTDAGGTPLPAACLLPNQQNQVTGATGNYRFDIVPGSAAACPVAQVEYRLSVVVPAGYQPGFSGTLLPQAGSLNAATCPVDALPGGACNVSASATAPVAGTAAFYFTSFLIGAGSLDVTYNHIPVDPIPAAIASLSKKANVSVAKRGDVLTYTIEARDVGFSPATITDVAPAGLAFVPGSAVANGVPVTPVSSGNRLTFPGLTPDGANRIRLTLRMAVSAKAAVGKLVNTAQLVDPATGTVVAQGIATIEVKDEHVFDCTDIIGKVFDDRNGNGIQDEDAREAGLPGVRLVTVNGLLITTDKNGRYSVPCAAVPDAQSGSNFILKLDDRTLPTGYRVTSENPRVARLTRGKVVRMNFAASLAHVVDVALTDAAFNAETHKPKASFNKAIAQLLSTVEREATVIRIAYSSSSASAAETKLRVANVRAEISRLIKLAKLEKHVTVEVKVVRR